MEIQIYFLMLRRGWWIIALTTLAALTISLTIDYTATPQYRASTRLIISPNSAIISGNDIVNSLDTLDKRSVNSTYAEVLMSSRVYGETLSALGIMPESVQDYTSSAVVLPDANVIEFSVEGPDPTTAVLLANSISQRAIEFSKSLNQVYDMSILDVAVPPEEPFSPQPLRDGALALILGMAVGAALAIVREQLIMPLSALRTRNMIDNVSSAFTRRHFVGVLEDELARSQISPLSLGLVQLHGLRDIADTLPEPMMQRLLHKVTDILRKELRGNDSIGRWDEVSFAILLPGTPGTAANRTLDRIRQSLTPAIKIDDLDFDLDPQVGVGIRQSSEVPHTLIQRAEEALQQNKQKSMSASPFSVDALDEMGYWEKGAEALDAPNKALDRQ